MPSIGEMQTELTAVLSGASIDDPRTEARLLVAHVTGMSVGQVFARQDHMLDDDDVTELRRHARDRSAGVPFAHIVGTKEFWSLPFNVTSDTLVPRPDTETLIELTLEVFADHEPPSRILDIGTGTGCIALTLLQEFPSSTAVATDVSAEVLAVARTNAEMQGMTNRLTFVESSWFEDIDGVFDLVVSNPPYIPTSDIQGLATDVRDHDPVLALDGGADGLDAYRQLFFGIGAHLTDAGFFVVEFGAGQETAVEKIAVDHLMTAVGRRQDLAKRPRCAAFGKKRVGIQQGNG